MLFFFGNIISVIGKALVLDKFMNNGNNKDSYHEKGKMKINTMLASGMAIWIDKHPRFKWQVMDIR